MSCLGLKTSLIMLIGHQPVQQQRWLCALAVMNRRDNLSPLIKTFRARYKHQNIKTDVTSHFTFYVPVIYQLDNTNYYGIYKLQETQAVTMMIIQQQTEILQNCCCLCCVSVFWISPLKLDAAACSSNFLDLVTECDAARGCSRG